MINPILHPKSGLTIQMMLRDFPQSVILTGPSGIGLKTIGEYIANKLDTIPFVVLPEKDEKIDIERGTITVDSIRRIYEKTKSIQSKKQLIIIDYAERMGIQAQNAFLKLLEEPGKLTYFIIATHEPYVLLSTIRSRAQLIELKTLTSVQSLSLLKDLRVNTEPKKSQIIFMANGLPAEMHRLATDDQYFTSRSKIIRDARQLLQGSIYERLTIGQIYKDDRKNALLLLKDAAHILRHSIKQQPQASIVIHIDKILKTYERIEANGNIRLCIARLVL
jgi:DNA polymerase-3 subunit delta'